MIKRYLLDIMVILGLALFIPILVVNRPDIQYTNQTAKQHAFEMKERTGEKGIQHISKIEGFKNIEETNIFSPDGAYTAPKGSAPLSLKEPFYRLAGVLTSGQKRAVIIDSSGEVFTIKEREKLGDGSVVSRIDNTSIVLKKGKREKKLTMFYIEKRI
jgi:hypothetical protein